MDSNHYPVGISAVSKLIELSVVSDLSTSAIHALNNSTET